MLDTNIPIDVKPIEWEIIQNILSEIIPDRSVWAFGSRVNGNKKEFSDLDLVVLGETSMTHEQEADLQNAFVRSDLPFKVDLVNWSRTSDPFKSMISQSYVIVR
ncbi:MAG: nucleotidyltransferase family protein [Burkholderiaceae bacterium]|jgi:predicted nucleotidyltransferase